AQTLPDPEARSLVEGIVSGKIEVLFGPGSALSVRLDGGGDEAFRKLADERLRYRLTGQGLKVMDGQPLTLAIQVTESATGKVLKLRGIGINSSDVDVPGKQVDCQATLTLNQGQALWETKARFQTPENFIGIVQTKDPIKYFHDRIWNEA